MSIALMTLAWKMDMQSGRKMVLLAMCDSANDEGKCWPSIEALMTKCSMGERTIQQHLAGMESDGIIKRDMRAGRSTVYNIDPRKLCTPAESAPPQISHPAVSAPTPAAYAPQPPQNLHPTPADFAPRNTKEPSKEPSKKRKVARGSRLPADWKLLGKHAKAALEIEPKWTEADIRLIGDKFKDHWIAASGNGACKLDWGATWRNWCRNEQQRGNAVRPTSHGAWFATEQSVAAKGAEFGLKAYPGESAFTFKARVQAVIDNGGVVPIVVSGQAVTPRPQPEADPKAQVSPENRKAALDAVRKLKPKGFDAPPP
ncbi:helix-turn-helix domain-containing protein [Collimonas sp. NPDC087041]|uniref:helix-turn-helix domain-containing protein n=1 Tax=Collimonas sp. NPDC087041 TaxID=3363960 RepID=UPI0038015640